LLDPLHRKVSAVADSTEFRNVKKVTICEDRSISVTMLFDPEHKLVALCDAEFVPDFFGDRDLAF